MMRRFILGSTTFFMAFFIVAAWMVTSCKRDEVFPELGDKLANPIDVANDETETYFWVLNSDYPRDYNKGSIITFSKEGERLATKHTRRLGRSLTVAGTTLIVTYSGEGDEASGLVEIYDAQDPKSLVLKRSFDVGICSPLNSVAKKSYKYFAVSCANGQLFAGELKSNLSDSTLQHVRNYPSSRRALHLDVTRNLLFAFPVDLGTQSATDSLEIDEYSYTDDIVGTETKAPNGIPDRFEKTRVDRRNKARRGIYQFAVYDLEKEASLGFPKQETLENYKSEMRFNYFDLSNFDGTPDVSRSASSNQKYYRTNFWEAKADPLDSDVFYLSHRGSSTSERSGSLHANSIIKVRITGDLRSTNTDDVPLTENVLSFERVYGFKGELVADKHFPGDFELPTIQGQILLVVNHFRDLVFFPGSQAYSSIAAKILGDNSWFTELSDGSTGHNYYQLAITSSGRAMAVSFYQNLVILLDVAPSTAITEYKTIK